MCAEKILLIAGLSKVNVSYKLKKFLIKQTLCIYEYSASLER